MSGERETPVQPAHPLDLAAIAAWTAFYDIDPEVAVRDWPNITPRTREKWRAAVDSAIMAAEAGSLDLVAKPTTGRADGRTPGQAAYEAFQASRAAREPMFLIVAWTHPLAEGAHGDWEAAAQAAIATVDDWDHYHQVVISERDEARDKLAQAEEVVADDDRAITGYRDALSAMQSERDKLRIQTDRVRKLATEWADTHGSDNERIQVRAIVARAILQVLGNEQAGAALGTTGSPASTALTVQDDATCGSVVVVDDDDAYPCGAPSRYLVERSDGDKSYGENGGSAEACGEHLAETVAGMVDGDGKVQAIVTIRWDKP